MATMIGDRRPRVRAATQDPLAVRVYSWVVTAVFVSASIIGWRRSAVTTMENVDELIALHPRSDGCGLPPRSALARDVIFCFAPCPPSSRNESLPPWQAAAVAFVGSMDVQEIRRGVPFSRMVFNRSEIGLSVMAASAGFHALAGDSVSWPSVLVPSLVALAVDAAVNAVLVAWPVAKLHAVSTGDVVRRMFGPRYGESLLRYVGVGLMAPLIAIVWLTTGAYGLAAFLIPLGLAWSSYVEAERLRRASVQIETKNQSLMLALEAIASERRDERLVLAGELHDSVLPAMFKVQLMGQVMRQDLAEGKLLDLEDDLPPLNEAISEAQIRVRGVTGGLRESSVGPGGLASALKSLAGDLEAVSSTRFELGSRRSRGDRYGPARCLPRRA